MEKLIILGATGSIGSQTIDIVKENPNEFEIVAISVGHNIEKLKNILSDIPTIKYVCVKEELDKEKLEKDYETIKFFSGDQGLLSIIDETKCSLVVNALVGFVGFLPSLHTLEKGINLALANKESLVVGGSLLKQAIKKSSAKLFAIDSEHCALAKCLEGHDRNEIKNLVITASGGSFRDLEIDKLDSVTIDEALHHPSWNMGNKITIDSATMMNKGFEIIEAMYLFDFELEKIKVLIHDESIIHSLVEFNDHSFLADIGPTNMKVAISYALFHNRRHEVKTNELNLEDTLGLHFRKLDLNRYPCLALALKAIKLGDSAKVVLNRANEEAVYSFLEGKIKFTDIPKVINFALDSHNLILNPNLDEIIKLDQWAKEFSQDFIRRLY